MRNIKVSELIAYPLKSTSGNYLQSSSINEKGLLYDRHWALINSENKIITARDFPLLLKIQTKLNSNSLDINLEGKIVLNIPLEIAGRELENIKIFSEVGTAIKVSEDADQWFSGYLGLECKLIFMNTNSQRDLLEKYGGKKGDIVSYADEAPVLLISEATLEDLNSKLDTPKTMKHFRPNIVLKGGEANQEDSWKYIKIGECEFEVIQLCKRCVFTTIDPNTLEKDNKSEPLRTLATYKKHPKGGISFGVHLVPRKLGKINIDDEVEVLN